MDLTKVKAVLDSHALSEASRKLDYGTAGFRAQALLLKNIGVRCGLIAALRSMVLGGKIVGLMITASHNCAKDNGVKIIEPDGTMLIQKWESLAEKFVKLDTPEVLSLIEAQVEGGNNKSATVFVASDTRPSCDSLAEEVKLGVEALGGKYRNLRKLTTPQLHFLVDAMNSSKATEPHGSLYTDHFCDSYTKAITSCKSSTLPALNIDCSNGVGYIAFSEIIKKLSSTLPAQSFNLYNTMIDQPDKLNFKCGADFVVTSRSACDLHSSSESIRPLDRWASFDGDADRLVYWFLNEERQFCLLDGNHLAILYATFICDCLKKTSLDLECAVVQTAYANSASTNYLTKELGLKVACTKTGVKYLHHEALKYDFGIYFESNGHGTITISEKARSQCPPELKLFVNLVNTTVGDAIADLFLAEFVLLKMGWSLQHWHSLYTEYPSRMAKVCVKDRSVIETFDAERQVSKPEALQTRIDAIVGQVRAKEKDRIARCFVRPSGTENIVRVYAEAETEVLVDWLCQMAQIAVFDCAEGTGNRPDEPQPL